MSGNTISSSENNEVEVNSGWDDLKNIPMSEVPPTENSGASAKENDFDMTGNQSQQEAQQALESLRNIYKDEAARDAAKEKAVEEGDF